MYLFTLCYYVAVQSLSPVWLFATTWTAAHQASLSFTISLSLLRPIFIELMMPSNHLILRRPLLLSSIFPSIRVISLGLIGLIFLLPKEFSGVFSDTIVQKYQFFHTQTSLWSSSHISLHDYWKNRRFDCTDLCQQSDVSAFQYAVCCCCYCC